MSGRRGNFVTRRGEGSWCSEQELRSASDLYTSRFTAGRPRERGWGVTERQWKDSECGGVWEA